LPISSYIQLPITLDRIREIKPKTVLDVGMGFGCYGFFIRAFLDSSLYHKERKSDWITYIEGIDIYKGYHTPHLQDTIYNKINYCDALQYNYSKRDWDLIICNDVLEHIEKPKGLELLQILKQNAKNIILQQPIGKNWIRRSNRANPYEAHISEWNIDEFKELGFQIVNTHKMQDKLNREIAIIIYKKSKEA
jgi:2-polyprenyl-3-methyl-5-hydroxy-6-metoxy-1,4-benzoquinol methylase